MELFSKTSDVELNYIYEEIVKGRENGLRPQCLDIYIRKVRDTYPALSFGEAWRYAENAFWDEVGYRHFSDSRRAPKVDKEEPSCVVTPTNSCRGMVEGKNEWVYGCPLHIDNGEIRIATSCLDDLTDSNLLTVCAYKIENHTLCLFTGMQDKEKNAIYTEDIVRNSRGNIGVIKWIQSFCGFCIVGPAGTESLDDSCLDIEVIGNVIENPDRLKGSGIIADI